MKMKKTISVVLVVLMLLALASCGKANKLLGTWKKTSGRFETDGWSKYCLIEEDDGDGTLEFTEDGVYNCVGKNGTTSGPYMRSNDTELVIVSDGISNTFTYSVKGKTLTLTNDYGECTFEKE